MVDRTVDKIKAFAFPILLSVISFFLVRTYALLDEIHKDNQVVKTTIVEIKKDVEYFKGTVSDHEQRLRGLERSQIPTDNTRVNYETYNR
jgi:hypothetical protein